jgi:hypothetical protein
MQATKEITNLVDKYIERIGIEDTDFVPVDDADSDAAYLLLNIPIKMLREYVKLKNQKKKLPDALEFWKETNLISALRANPNKYYGQGRANLGDVLDYLGGDVRAEYQKLFRTGRIRLMVQEIPELYENEN